MFTLMIEYNYTIFSALATKEIWKKQYCCEVKRHYLYLFIGVISGSECPTDRDIVRYVVVEKGTEF